jgi:uncharacterized Zn finger protein
MAIIEVSEETLRSVTGAAVFGQAQELAGKVTGLRVDGAVIEAMVDGTPVRVRVRPDGLEPQCECPADGVCAHAVAAALAWVQTGKEENAPDLYEVMRLQDPDWLAAQLAGFAASDPSLARLLLAEAEDAGALAEITEIRADFDEFMDELSDEVSDMDEYDDWAPEAGDLDEMIDDAEALAGDVPDAVRRLAEHMAARLEQFGYDVVDDALARVHELRKALEGQLSSRRRPPMIP